jgi:hypothetical protein
MPKMIAGRFHDVLLGVFELYGSTTGFVSLRFSLMNMIDQKQALVVCFVKTNNKVSGFFFKISPV